MEIYIADIKSHQNSDGSCTGHYIPVAKNYQQMFKDRCRVVVAGGPVYKRYFGDEELLKLPYSIMSDSPKGKLKTFINSIVLFWKARGNVIVLQQSTAVTSFISIALFFWWTGELYLIQYNTEAINCPFKRFLYSLAKLKISGFICPNEHVGKAFRCSYVAVPDYIYADNELPVMKSFEDREYDFCILGTIHRDKGVIEAAQKLRKCSYKVLIAGRVATSDLQYELETVVAGCDNIELRLEYVSNEKYVEYIQNSKYCLLNYYGTYLDRSSGVVLDIIHHGTPVVGRRCIALKIIEDYNIGCLYNDIEGVDFETTLNRETYKLYCEHIIKYLSNQKDDIEKLEKFLKK